LRRPRSLTDRRGTFAKPEPQTRRVFASAPRARARTLRAVTLALVTVALALVNFSAAARGPRTQSGAPAPRAGRSEYLWLEAENMRGFSVDKRNEPVLNPWWTGAGRAQSPGWGMSGPGVSAEWSQGGESEWNSAAASADETRATLYEDVEVPRDGRYKIWARYADWAARDERFVVRVEQQGREAARHEFGARDRVDPRDEVSLHWGWAFAWDSSGEVELKKGAARVSVEIERAAAARRHVDCLLLTDDAGFVPAGRRKPEFAGWRVLREWAARAADSGAGGAGGASAGGANVGGVAALIDESAASGNLPETWRRPKVAGREFLMPWNISTQFWEMYERPAAERPLYPFHVEGHLLAEFVAKYKGAQQVPLFSSKLVAPVVYLNDLPRLLKEGSAFLKFLRETRAPFAVLINYGAAQFGEAEGQAAWKLLGGELSGQFLGWVSGESIGHVYADVAATLTLAPSMSRREMLEAYRAAYARALERKWSATFHAPAGAMWGKLIPAQSTSSTAYAHALGRWGVRLIGIESAAVQPGTSMRVAFTRGAARQFGAAYLYYHAPTFGDTATTFTRAQNFGGPDHFFHSRYGPSMGASLSWYRKSYFLHYMSGASAVYLEQGYDQFFKPGPGEHPLQLSPVGRITEEFMAFAERHTERGVPDTPVAILLDPAHGWDMTDWPHWPFGVARITRHDRALRELFGAAYYPLLVNEGEDATSDRQAFVNSIFGDIFDVIVATDARANAEAKTTAAPASTRAGTRAGTPGGAEGKAATAATANVPTGVTTNVPTGTTTNVLTGVTTSATARATGASLQTAGAAAQTTGAAAHALTGEQPGVLEAYRAVVVGGRVEWPRGYVERLREYVRRGGTLVVNAAQAGGLPEDLLGVRSAGATAEADDARCLSPGEAATDLGGQVFRYERVETRGARVLVESPSGDPLVTVNRAGRGSVVYCAVPDLLGLDDRLSTPAAHLLVHLLADAAPVRVRGDVQRLFSRTGRGWVVTLINNRGVYKPQQGLARVDRTEASAVSIRLCGRVLDAAREWTTETTLPVERGGEGADFVRLEVPAGGVRVVELVERR
jgi:hypothetical protein